jgi:hypothetical protein
MNEIARWVARCSFRMKRALVLLSLELARFKSLVYVLIQGLGTRSTGFSFWYNDEMWAG